MGSFEQHAVQREPAGRVVAEACSAGRGWVAGPRIHLVSHAFICGKHTLVSALGPRRRPLTFPLDVSARDLPVPAAFRQRAA